MSEIDISGAQWRTSSYSNGQANCVEVAVVSDRLRLVAVRDSKAANAAGLIFTEDAWRRFTRSMN